jgi:hypothetical protein
MAKDSRNKWQIVLWNDINVRLLHRVHLAGNKYMLAAAYLLHISPVIATNSSSHRSCLALPHTSLWRPPRQYVTSSHTRNSTGIAQFLQTVRARPSSIAFCRQIPCWIPISVLGLAALQHSPPSTHDSATFCHLLTCHNSLNVSGFDSRRGLIMVVHTATTPALGTIQSKFSGHRASVLQYQNYQVLKPTTGLYRVPWRRMCGAVPPLCMRVHVMLLN